MSNVPTTLKTRVGSRPWRLSQLAPGESLLFEVPGALNNLQSQILVDARRVGIHVTLETLLAVSPKTETVVKIVRCTRD